MHFHPISDDDVKHVIQMLWAAGTTIYGLWLHHRQNGLKKQVKQIKDACTYPACGHICEVPKNGTTTVLQRAE